MTDFLPETVQAAGLPTTVDDLLALPDDAVNAAWGRVFLSSRLMRDAVGLLLYRELRVKGERALGARAAEAARELEVTAATLSRWRTEAERHYHLPPATVRAAAQQARPDRGVARPPAVTNRTNAISGASHPSQGDAAYIDVDTEEDGTERPRLEPVPERIHDVKRAAAVIRVEPNEDELAVVDAWSALLQVNGSEVFLKMLHRVKPPTIDQGGISREHAVLRRAWKKLTGRET